MGTKENPGQPIELVGSSVVRYSYNQIMVYDSSEKTPGCLWTHQHWRQGFARRDTTICFSTLNQAGKAHLSIVNSAGDVPGVLRAIRSSLKCSSGKMRIEGPDEFPVERFVKVIPGVYSVTFSQRLDDEGELSVYISFDRVERMSASQILKADASLLDSIVTQREDI
jgi:hypothetical protein